MLKTTGELFDAFAHVLVSDLRRRQAAWMAGQGQDIARQAAELLNDLGGLLAAAYIRLDNRA